MKKEKPTEVGDTLYKIKKHGFKSWVDKDLAIPCLALVVAIISLVLSVWKLMK